jgi:SAM-dependent MidA family methyltransferase
MTESSPLAAQLAARIRSGGPITFAEFMAECLYHPEYGYYSRAPEQLHRDYYTSADVHPIFGRLLARQLEEVWRVLGAPREFMVVEVGAGVGRLARHVLDFAAREAPEFYAATQYVAVERSAARRAIAGEYLSAHLAVGRSCSSDAIPATIPAGCIFSNELLDALPTHRVVMHDEVLREVYVDIEGERFIEIIAEPSTPALAEYFRMHEISLEPDQQGEVCLDACMWIENAGRVLGRGFVMTIDYGREARALYGESHNRGTLMAYRDHQATESVLDVPGDQDLTAHVNFTALELWGNRSGLKRTGLVTQSRFLVALGRANQFADLYEPGQSEVEKLRARLLLKNLIHPEGLGETFRVLIQHKGIETPKLTGLESYRIAVQAPVSL